MVSGSASNSKLPKAIDFSHQLSKLSVGRKNSPLKELYKVIEGHEASMIQLAGGMPSPQYFPVETISGDLLLSSTFSSKSTGFGSNSSPAHSTTHITIPKYPPPGAPADPKQQPLTLSTLLQYGQASGVAALNGFLRAHVESIYQPAYADWEVFLNCGNTHGTYLAFNLLLNEGDSLIVEEFSYPSAMEAARSLGIRQFVPIKMDAEGMLPEDLELQLANWPTTGSGRRPRVMYTVTVGQNPTGGTLSLERRKKIYDICVKYDVIIVEDDPYYFLQMPAYSSSNANSAPAKPMNAKSWLQSLAPSYLRIDYQGRVIRLDTFSKVIAPGVRCGFITANPLFVERIFRHAEVSTQGASGLSQGIIAKLLVEEWGMDRWYEWLQSLGSEYTKRRDYICSALEKEFGLVGKEKGGKDRTVRIRQEKESEGGWLEVRERKMKTSDLIFFTAPTAGMFVWLGFNIHLHPRFKEFDYRDSNGVGRRGDNTMELMDELWRLVATEGEVLVSPGRMFGATEEMKLKACFFRIAFSMSGEEELNLAMKRIREVTVRFFES
ncbi:PLP-dependent transferase [Atractiella rhizophila]|nr:PLP-dependent transferase [Atractiella rhizophila]